MTTIVDLGTLWLSDAADPTEFRSFPVMSALERLRAKPGRTQSTASGRQRVVTRAGEPRQWSASLPHCSRDQLDWLEARCGFTLCARDDRGHKFFGTFFEVSVSEHAYNLEADTSLEITAITFSEAV